MSVEQLPSGDNPAQRATIAGGLRCILKLSGEVIASSGAAPPPEFGVAAGATARDAERAARLLTLGRWEAIVIESDMGVLGLAASGPDSDVLAAAEFSAGTPVGAAQRAAARLAAEWIRE